MNTPSPLVPQGSLQPKPKFLFGFFTIVSLHVLAIGVLLIQGCNKNSAKKADDTALDANTNAALPPYNPPTNSYPNAAATNTPAPTSAPLPAFGLAAAPSNASPFPDNKPAEITPPPADEKEYVVAKGDFLGTIARKHGVTLAALKKANPGVDSKKLKVGQKIKIPGGAATPDAHAAEAESTSAGGSYTVKGGDNLTKIAKAHGTTAPKLRALNNLSTDKLKVGQKLKIPAGGLEKMAAAKGTDEGLDKPAPLSAPGTSTNVLR
jgi:LysM repeat protein